MSNTNFQLVAACIVLVITIALAFAALVFTILWELTWKKKAGGKTKVKKLSEGVSDKLDPTLDIKISMMKII